MNTIFFKTHLITTPHSLSRTNWREQGRWYNEISYIQTSPSPTNNKLVLDNVTAFRIP